MLVLKTRKKLRVDKNIGNLRLLHYDIKMWFYEAIICAINIDHIHDYYII